MSVSALPELPEFSISLKRTKHPFYETFQVTSSADSAEVAKRLFDENTIDWVESFFVIALSRANRVIGFYKVSHGGVTGTVVDPKVVMQFALLSNATSLILTHNHPSCRVTPSKSDLETTRKISQACDLMDMCLLDHIIVSSEGHFSFADEGRL